MKLSWEVFRNLGLAIVERNRHDSFLFPAVSSHNFTQTSQRDFRAMFGVSWFICEQTWNLIDEHGFYQLTRKAEHLLWTLLFLKIYSNEKTHCSITGTTPKTFRKWVWQVLEEIGVLQSYAVSIIVYFVFNLSSTIDDKLNHPLYLFFVYYTDTMGEQEV